MSCLRRALFALAGLKSKLQPAFAWLRPAATGAERGERGKKLQRERQQGEGAETRQQV